MTTLRLGPLEELGADPGITDVIITCEGRVWVDRGDGMTEYHPRIPLRAPATIREYAVQLCSQLGRRLDDARPIADASDDHGVRVHAAIAPLVPQGASISIRFPSRSSPSLDSLLRQSMFPAPWLNVLRNLVRQRATMLITGGTGTGKTTLMKALLNEVEPSERIVTVEETRELNDIASQNHVALATREANVEGAGAIGLPELVKATLRMRPDRVVLGECRGEEIADLLRAYNSGHRGGMTTLHADGVARVPSRLTSLGMLAGLRAEALSLLIEGAFDIVIHLDRSAGRRRIAQLGMLSQAGTQLIGIPLSTWSGNGPPSYSAEWNRFASAWQPI